MSHRLMRGATIAHMHPIALHPVRWGSQRSQPVQPALSTDVFPLQTTLLVSLLALTDAVKAPVQPVLPTNSDAEVPVPRPAPDYILRSLHSSVLFHPTQVAPESDQERETHRTQE